MGRMINDGFLELEQFLFEDDLVSLRIGKTNKAGDCIVLMLREVRRLGLLGYGCKEAKHFEKHPGCLQQQSLNEANVKIVVKANKQKIPRKTFSDSGTLLDEMACDLNKMLAGFVGNAAMAR